MPREIAVDRRRELVAAQTDVGEHPIVEGCQLADGQSTPAPASILLEDPEADQCTRLMRSRLNASTMAWCHSPRACARATSRSSDAPGLAGT
jgi:hypothetical protein